MSRKVRVGRRVGRQVRSFIMCAEEFPINPAERVDTELGPPPARSHGRMCS